MDWFLYDRDFRHGRFNPLHTIAPIYFKAYPASIYLFKVNNRNAGTTCGTCSKLTMKTPERRHFCRSCVFIVNFEHISHLVLVFLLITLSREMLVGFPDSQICSETLNGMGKSPPNLASNSKRISAN